MHAKAAVFALLSISPGWRGLPPRRSLRVEGNAHLLKQSVSQLRGTRWALFATALLIASIAVNPLAGTEPACNATLSGVALVHGRLRARVVANEPRYMPLNEEMLPGYNGLASLIHTDQNRNIFSPVGMNYEMSQDTLPKSGKHADAWNAPRLAPMGLEQIDAHTARLTQAGADAAGLNIEITFRLGEECVDQTITTWPDIDLTESSTFWASYMNLVQNTSLYLHGTLRGTTEPQWLELTSAGHFGQGSYYRPFDVTGRDWHEFLTDNPVMRQAIKETPESRAATEAAGFRAEARLDAWDNFFFGFVDDYVALWIFRPTPDGRFNPWISASGAEAVRRPAWDYGIKSGPQKAGERRTFHVRLVYRKWRGLDDLLQEVKRFQSGGDP